MPAFATDEMTTPEPAAPGVKVKTPRLKKAVDDGWFRWLTKRRVTPLMWVISCTAAVGRPVPAGQYVCTSYRPGGNAVAGKYAVRPPTLFDVNSAPL